MTIKDTGEKKKGPLGRLNDWKERLERDAEGLKNVEAQQSPYRGWRVFAFRWKARLQMAVGVIAMVLLIPTVISAIFGQGDCVGDTSAASNVVTTSTVVRSTFASQMPPCKEHSFPAGEDIIRIIGNALAVAAAIELAYTLFTPSPDEALNPLMLGLSAALLIGFSRTTSLDYKSAIAALLFIIALGVLFAIRWRLEHLERPSAEPKGETKRP